MPRLIAPRGRAFALLTPKETELAPGLELVAELSYHCDGSPPPTDEKLLVISVGRNEEVVETLEMPVRVCEPYALLELESSRWSFGVVGVRSAGRIRQHVTVTNAGGREGVLHVRPPTHAALKVHPLECHPFDPPIGPQSAPNHPRITPPTTPQLQPQAQPQAQPQSHTPITHPNHTPQAHTPITHPNHTPQSRPQSHTPITRPNHDPNHNPN